MHKRDLQLLLFFFLIVLAFFSPVLCAGKTFFLRDLTYIFHPWRALTAEMVQKGQMPLWDPYAYCGMPLLANLQTAVFYPFTQLFYLFGFVTGLRIYHIAHVFLAGFFAYLGKNRQRLVKTDAARGID